MSRTRQRFQGFGPWTSMKVGESRDPETIQGGKWTTDAVLLGCALP